jgi:hypothetical protein
MYAIRNVVKCEKCGCAGNKKCGAVPVNGDCALDEALICPCCKKLGTEENKERWTK